MTEGHPSIGVLIVADKCSRQTKRGPAEGALSSGAMITSVLNRHRSVRRSPGQSWAGPAGGCSSDLDLPELTAGCGSGRDLAELSMRGGSSLRTLQIPTPGYWLHQVHRGSPIPSKALRCGCPRFLLRPILFPPTFETSTWRFDAGISFDAGYWLPGCLAVAPVDPSSAGDGAQGRRAEALEGGDVQDLQRPRLRGQTGRFGGSVPEPARASRSVQRRRQDPVPSAGPHPSEPAHTAGTSWGHDPRLLAQRDHGPVRGADGRHRGAADRMSGTAHRQRLRAVSETDRPERPARAGWAPGAGQPIRSQGTRGPGLAGASQAQPIPYALHSHQLQLGQSGGTLVQGTDRPAVAPRSFHSCAGAHRRD
jgi:hypothetical protein